MKSKTTHANENHKEYWQTMFRLFLNPNGYNSGFLYDPSAILYDGESGTGSYRNAVIAFAGAALLVKSFSYRNTKQSRRLR